MSLYSPRVKGLVSSSALLEGSGNFKKWGLVGDFRAVPLKAIEGTRPLSIFLSFTLGREMNGPPLLSAPATTYSGTRGPKQ
jgi:hypothetical protein